MICPVPQERPNPLKHNGISQPSPRDSPNLSIRPIQIILTCPVKQTPHQTRKFSREWHICNLPAFHGLSEFILIIVVFLPDEVLMINPIFRRYGSTTSTSVSVSSWSVAAMASMPTGPPL